METNTEKVREFCQSRKVGTMMFLTCPNSFTNVCVMLNVSDCQIQNELERNITIKLGYANAKVRSNGFTEEESWLENSLLKLSLLFCLKM